jgi:hypothetical protein
VDGDALRLQPDEVSGVDVGRQDHHVPDPALAQRAQYLAAFGAESGRVPEEHRYNVIDFKPP